MINRIDSICHAVLKGNWIPSRRSYDYNAVTSSYTTKLLDSPSAMGDLNDSAVFTSGSQGVKEDNSLLSQFTKVKKHVREKEFTVKINDVCSFLLLLDLILIADLCSVRSMLLRIWLPAAFSL